MATPNRHNLVACSYGSFVLAFSPPLTLTLSPEYRGEGTRRSRSLSARRGVIFVTALWVMLILGVMTLLFARAMRTEIVGSQNRASGAQADAILMSAEQYSLGVLDAFTPGNTASNTPGDALGISQVPAEAVQVGSAGYFWFMRPNPDDFQNHYYGFVDESSKLYLNIATTPNNQLLQELQKLPISDQSVPAAIVDFIDADSDPQTNGAESDYYMSLPRPYVAKNAGLESIDELLLVKGVTPDPALPANSPTALYGGDLNQNGVLDPTEPVVNSTSSNGVDSSCGLAPFVTVWATQPDTDATGKARVNVNPQNNGAGAPPNPPRPGGPQMNQALYNALIANPGPGLTTTRANAIAQAAGNQTFTSVFDLVAKTRMQDDETKKVLDYLTTSTSKTLVGKININTVSVGVLQCLPNLQPGEAQQVIAARSNAASSITGGSGMEWIPGQVSASVLSKIGPYITGHSYQYSADIVAVTADGHSFRREKIVIDCQKSPAKIIYRKDLTSLGWPLPADIRTALRDGSFQPGSTAPGLVWRP